MRQPRDVLTSIDKICPKVYSNPLIITMIDYDYDYDHDDHNYTHDDHA